MKQILQSLNDGSTYLEEVPIPNVNSNSILIETSCSLVSLGTEKMLVDFGKANYLQKAMQQPDKVKAVIDKMRVDGIGSTLEAVKNKITLPIPLGYCNVGTVVEIGENITDFSLGDRVVSNGPHAEYVVVSKNLAAKIPDSISDESAVFTIVSAIGLQGIRLIQPSLGETVVVMGLGLIGLLTCQLLKANGCIVIGVDIDNKKCDIASKWGINTVCSDHTSPIKNVLEMTDQLGADGIVITASSKSKNLISDAAKMARKRGKIVLVGVVGLDLDRSDFYEKELTFQVSCSYGPGRYDMNYEEHGHDYPFPFVRWTEKRNFQAVLSAVESGSLDPSDLITGRYELNEFEKIYNDLNSKSSIASIINYPKKQSQDLKRIIDLKSDLAMTEKEDGIIGLIGAGNYTKNIVLPCLKNSRATIKYIASATGVSGTQSAKKYGIHKSTTDYTEILKDSGVDTIFITTRHNLHAKLVIESLNAGKNVFVEKPLALNMNEIEMIIESLNQRPHQNIMIGFNRRFSTHIESIKNDLGQNSGPININLTMNAGPIEKDHWVHDIKVGGGRLIGEACHLLDLGVFLANSEIKEICVNSMGNKFDLKTDNASILVKFENGSNASINYFSNGSKKYQKERVEVYSKDRVWISNNYRKTEVFSSRGSRVLVKKSDKGQQTQFTNYVNLVRNGGKAMIPMNELINVSKASVMLLESLKKRKWIKIK